MLVGPGLASWLLVRGVCSGALASRLLLGCLWLVCVCVVRVAFACGPWPVPVGLLRCASCVLQVAVGPWRLVPFGDQSIPALFQSMFDRCVVSFLLEFDRRSIGVMRFIVGLRSNLDSCPTGTSICSIHVRHNTQMYFHRCSSSSGKKKQNGNNLFAIEFALVVRPVLDCQIAHIYLPD